jgi:hypothetical protein
MGQEEALREIRVTKAEMQSESDADQVLQRKVTHVEHSSS